MEGWTAITFPGTLNWLYANEEWVCRTRSVATINRFYRLLLLWGSSKHTGPTTSHQLGLSSNGKSTVQTHGSTHSTTRSFCLYAVSYLEHIHGHPHNGICLCTVMDILVWRRKWWTTKRWTPSGRSNEHLSLGYMSKLYINIAMNSLNLYYEIDSKKDIFYLIILFWKSLIRWCHKYNGVLYDCTLLRWNISRNSNKGPPQEEEDAAAVAAERSEMVQ